ncbi:A/G-specific adenine glycosylase [Alkalihalophilus marmarensis]|uniref:A/G-specific adenine glycosylase n=1 Tax=Alkalihalophilus marmarensis TaxID=521377 RepID=UPI002E23BFF5|nr:A/G-specific adenine glycosylase [Alkalihalophilus marmarensis]MED1599963.1 A/G-specific adenine glycosylase [Alkalihalophilus marmarensis]
MQHEKLNEFNISQFQQDLINWFKENQRTLPWRENKDPYRVWVSEIMLQQTRVDTVIPYYLNFMREFPTLEDLAYAEEDRILKAWEGLGYYSRVRNLQTAVREVVEEYSAAVPDTLKEISALKGVGPYTAGAILSIAYGKPEPAVDGNVMRVLSRVLEIDEDIAKAKTRKTFEAIIYDLISKEDPSSFNQGLMELGALICTPTSPGCLLCPVREHCIAYNKGIQDTLPVKSKKKKAKRKLMAAFVIKDEDGKVLIEKRPDKGLLAGLWQFPNVEVDSHSFNKEEMAEALSLAIGKPISIRDRIQKVEHVFSHIVWDIDVYTAVIATKEWEKEGLRFVDQYQIEDFAFPVSHQKIIKHYFSESF